MNESDIIRDFEKYKSYYENAPLAYQSLDENGYILEVNKSWLKTLGYSKDDVIGKWFGNFIISEEIELFKENFMRFKKEGEGRKIEYTMIHKDGSYLNTLYNGRITRNEHGNFIRTHCIFQDITNQKKLELENRIAKEKYESLIENIPDAIYSTINKADGSTTFMSKRWEEWTGYSSESLRKNPELWLETIHPDDRKDTVKAYYLASQKEREYTIEYRIINKNSRKIIYIRDHGICVKDKAKRITRYEGILTNISLQKSIELKLKESEERFKTLFEVAPASIVFSDLDSNIIMSNNQFIKLHGITNPEKLKGMSVTKFFSKKDIPALKESIQKSLEGVPRDSMEYTMLKEDGTEFLAEASSRAIRDKNDEIIGLIGVAQDITMRKKAEIELKESEEKFRTITEQSFMGIGIIQDGLFKYFNQRAADINGFSVEEIQNWKPYEFSKLIHPEDREFVMEQAKKKQDGKSDVITRYTYRIIKKSGEIAWMDNYSKSINYKGRPADLVMTEVITDKIIAEQQLKESEEFFRTITEQSLLGIIIMQDGIIKYVNDIALNHSGYSRNEVMNLPETQLLKYIYPKDHDIIKQAIAENIPNLTFRLITKDGNIKWIDLNIKKNIYKGREAYLIALLDVTEKKEAEQIIKDENTKLKELDQLKNEFVSRASHELKTPLNSIVSASTLLIEIYRDSLDDRASRLISVINKGGKRLDDLIGDLLDVSRIDSGKLTIKKKKEDIVEIIKSCTHDMIYLINQRNLNIEFKYLQGRIFIDIDKIRIEQVILNILSNAIKNTPSDGTISFDIKSEKKFIDISITDTGVGFTKKEKEKLFQKFGKIERHGKGMDIIPEGTGLGLYISKEIIELHGGEIWIESKGRNKGSTIVIRLLYKK